MSPTPTGRGSLSASELPGGHFGNDKNKSRVMGELVYCGRSTLASKTEATGFAVNGGGPCNTARCAWVLVVRPIPAESTWLTTTDRWVPVLRKRSCSTK